MLHPILFYLFILISINNIQFNSCMLIHIKNVKMNFKQQFCEEQINRFCHISSFVWNLIILLCNPIFHPPIHHPPIHHPPIHHPPIHHPPIHHPPIHHPPTSNYLNCSSFPTFQRPLKIMISNLHDTPHSTPHTQQ